eukprot:8262707-Pyramimonas_sp.AAC.1
MVPVCPGFEAPQPSHSCRPGSQTGVSAVSHRRSLHAIAQYESASESWASWCDAGRTGGLRRQPLEHAKGTIHTNHRGL